MLHSLPQPLRVGLATLVLLLVAPQPGETCPPWETGGTKTGELEHAAIDESSGLAASRRHPGHFWTHNDSGGEAHLFLLDDSGAHVGLLRLAGVEAADWEDVAVAPCSSEGDASCIYAADIGDNRGRRESVSITRVREPALPDDRPAGWVSGEATTVEFQYPDGPRNAETLLVHPETAASYVVEKTMDRESTIYRVPRRGDNAEGPAQAEPVGGLEVDQTLGGLITGGDISPDGREFSIRTYVKVFTFCAGDGGSFESAFEADPVESYPRVTIQSEALAYGLEGEALWFTSEGKHPPLIRLDRAQ